MKTLVIETLNNQPGHVRDVRVVMNHVRVVCPILLEREKIIIWLFCFKSLLQQHHHKFYTLKVCKLRLFLPKKKQHECVDISYFS